MKSFFQMVLFLCVLLILFACAAAQAESGQAPADQNTSAAGIISLPEEHLSEAVNACWNNCYAGPDFRVWVNGSDDPAELPVTGKHAFVVLGFQLQDGEMTEELKSRCDAAAAAASCFPDSLLVCSGGATGDNNPQKHTEAGLMKDYLVHQHGIAADRILTDERAMTTEDNALNTFEILKQQGVESITVVTSDYHQRRAAVLYGALAAYMQQVEGYSVSLAGNWSCATENYSESDRSDMMIAVMQLTAMMNRLTSGLSEVREMLITYGSRGDSADGRTAELLARIRSFNPKAADRWEAVMALWKECSKGLEINMDILPDGLPDTDELCLVALGYQLKSDGSMRPELIERLKVVLACAEKYPNALILCCGGPTASGNKEATEAGRMAEWLIANGIQEDRILVEDKSLTTAQNATCGMDLLEKEAPQVRALAMISSDYHIATGTLLFGAVGILRAGDPEQQVRVVSNAAWDAPSGSLSSAFQAGALVEIAGDVDTAYQIYYGTYDLHELPPLSE